MSEQALYDVAVTLLSKRDYASGEIRRCLLKQASVDEVDKVIERLLSHHYLDDSRLIDKEIQKQLVKLHGIARIKQELRKKELDPLLIEQAIEDTDVDWFELCYQAKEKKFGSHSSSDPKEKAKMVRYLQYRGHSLSAIMECV